MTAAQNKISSQGKMKLTGERVEQLQALKAIRRYLTKTEFSDVVKQIEKEEKKAVAAAERARRQQLKEEARAQVAAVLQKAKVRADNRKKKANKKADLAAVLSKVETPAEDDLYGFFQTIRDKEVRMLVFNKATGAQVLDVLFPVPHTYDPFRKALLNLCGAGSDIEADVIQSSRFVAIQPDTTTAAVRLIQSYLDGIQHCVFTPIISMLEARLHQAPSDSYSKRTKQRLSRLHELAAQYSEGVPEADMAIVAKAAGMKIIIHDIIGDTVETYNPNVNNVLHLSNTRTNHVEAGIVVRSNPEDVSQERLNEILTECKETGQHYEFDGDLRDGVPRRINTLRGSFRRADPDMEYFKMFDEVVGIRNKQINAMKHPELNEFLKAGRIINGWSCPLGNDGETACYDLSAAYTQFKHAPHYDGFLGRVHQFRSGSFSLDFMREHVGFYRVVVEGEVPTLLQHLGLYAGLQTIMFSQELLYYAELGLSFSSDMGAWGERFHFEFPDYMMLEKRYALWSGRLGSDRTHDTYTFPGSAEFAGHCKSQGHETIFFREDKMITIKVAKKYRLTAHHLLGAITAYTRMNLVAAMLQFKPEQLCRVVLDGIYYKGEAPVIARFNDKPLHDEMSQMPWFSPAGYDMTAPPMHQIVRDSFLGGQGGSGKTYSVLTDKGFIDPMIIVPCHVLGKDAHGKYGVAYETIHKMVGMDCRPYREERRIPGCVVLDEITQYDAVTVDKLRAMYPECLFIGIGDISRDGKAYQCRTGDGITWSSVWKPSGVDYFEYLTDRRSLDPELAALKLQIRDAMDTLRGEDERVLMTLWAKKNLPRHSMDFQPGNVCIAATHRTSQALIKKGIVSGYYKTGGHVSDTPQPGFTERGSFTIHSFQGRTLETETVWIFLDDLFEISMLYTAVSRVRHMSQLRFIHGSL